MRRRLLLLLVTLLVTGCGGMGGARGANDAEHPLVGAAPPAFELPTAVGEKKTVPLTAGQGKVTIVDFWATWCDPCRDSFPHYQKLVDKHPGRLVVVGISIDEDPAGIEAFVKETGVSFPILWDEGQKVSTAYDPPTMPTSYLIDKNGVIRYVHAGFHPGDEAKIAAEVEELLR